MANCEVRLSLPCTKEVTFHLPTVMMSATGSGEVVVSAGARDESVGAGVVVVLPPPLWPLPLVPPPPEEFLPAS